MTCAASAAEISRAPSEAAISDSREQEDSQSQKTGTAISKLIFEANEMPEKSPEKNKLVSLINSILLGVVVLTLVALGFVIRHHVMRARKPRRRHRRSSSMERSVDA
jgi:hypothetical protein